MYFANFILFFIIDKQTLQTVRYNLSLSKYDCPAQPNLSTFPKTSGRKFSSNIYDMYEWVEYSVKDDAIFCFPCRHFSSNIVLSGEAVNQRMFLDVGCQNWKKIKEKLEKHNKSARHIASTVSWVQFRQIQNKSSDCISSVINSDRNSEITKNREHVRVLLTVTSLLGRQGIAFRGHREGDCSDNHGNFKETLYSFAEYSESLRSCLDRRYGHYTSPEYQNELIKVFGDEIIKVIVADIKKAVYFTIMCDETKDRSRKEQMAVLVRYYLNGKIMERALGTFCMEDVSAEGLFTCIINLFEKLGVDIQNCVAQCYDGASVMSGCDNGVQSKIKNLVHHAIYVHCHAHRLNLILVKAVKNIQVVFEFFEIVKELYNFISNSNTRHVLFLKAQKELNQKELSLERSCETRWLYWYRSLNKILLRFEAILAVLDSTKNGKDKQAAAEAEGLLRRMQCISFVVTLMAMESLLSKTYGLSMELQNNSLIIFDAPKKQFLNYDLMKNMKLFTKMLLNFVMILK